MARKTTPKTEQVAEQEVIKDEPEHYFRCMTIVVPGSKCNCYVGAK